MKLYSKKKNLVFNFEFFYQEVPLEQFLNNSSILKSRTT